MSAVRARISAPTRRRTRRPISPRRFGGSNVSIETNDIPRTGACAGTTGTASAPFAPRAQVAAALAAMFPSQDRGAPELSGYIIATG